MLARSRTPFANCFEVTSASGAVGVGNRASDDTDNMSFRKVHFPGISFAKIRSFRSTNSILARISTPSTATLRSVSEFPKFSKFFAGFSGLRTQERRAPGITARRKNPRKLGRSVRRRSTRLAFLLPQPTQFPPIETFAWVSHPPAHGCV